MNGGSPAIASLRALRHVPVVVDDVGVASALAAAHTDIATSGTEDLVRWTRAWLVTWQGALYARDVIGTVPPWTVALTLKEVGTLKGDPDRRRRDAALALLERAGLAAVGPGRTAATLAERLFMPHRVGLELDWTIACRLCRAEPAPLLVARALAELVVPPHEPTAIALRDLVLRTGYGQKQVRVALQRLTDGGMLVVSELAGMATEYRFTDTVLRGRVSRDSALNDVDARRPAPPSTGRGSPKDPPRVSSPTRQWARPVALRMTVGGVTFTLGAGLSPHVELGPDGVPHVVIDPADTQ